MSKIIMVFASMTGNTEDMADAIAEGVQEAGAELDQKNVIDVNAGVLEEYEGILLGAYTWGDGDLPDEFLDFYEEMDDLDLSGKKAAVFGSCDSSYSEYGAAVDTLIAKLQERGAEVVLDGLKVELSPSQDEKETCKQFGVQFVGHLGS
ncbi:flavodoxin [Paenibacillus doosanensis]|uniref:Flavodoxin n=1 Tax=Paenibacillus konkukensis TaxID=2020716 RepID=A0ABY4RZA1_9BACL|nr:MULTISPECIES: flavodoxin [Paenibacillus]MCS7459271.1 flavodoxin [Paenibacillus doosanensis]UQZ87065.1 Flavodoxin [Paenibacillus konkukensis]